MLYAQVGMLQVCIYAYVHGVNGCTYMCECVCTYMCIYVHEFVGCVYVCGCNHLGCMQAW